MDKYSIVISVAKDLLKKNRRDKAHDLAHHQDVWLTCQEIVKAEQLRVTMKLLEVAALWHDVLVGEAKWPSKLNVDETCVYLSELLVKNGFSDQERRTIIETVKHHEFRDRPTTLEGLVLQDADKLDILSENRWSRTLEEYRSGKMTREKTISYAKTFFKWVPILEATFHFQYSRQRARAAIDSFWSNSQWLTTIEELGLQSEYTTAKKAMSSRLTTLKRFCIRLVNLPNEAVIRLQKLLENISIVIRYE